MLPHARCVVDPMPGCWLDFENREGPEGGIKPGFRVELFAWRAASAPPLRFLGVGTRCEKLEFQLGSLRPWLGQQRTQCEV